MTSLTTSATLESPEAMRYAPADGYAEAHGDKQVNWTASGRKPRCRLLDAKLNRCPNETLSEDGIQLCACHLAQAYRDYLTLTGPYTAVDRLALIGGRP